MAKFTLAAPATFKATVKIPVPGAKPAPVEFKFNGMAKDEFKKFLETMADREDTEVILAVASGWDLEDPFNADNVDKLVQNYIGSAKAVLETFIGELTAARLGN